MKPAHSALTLRLPTRMPVLWRVMMLSLTLGVVVARGSDWLAGQPFGLLPTHWIMAAAAPSVLLWYLLIPARAGEAGLQLFDPYGFPRRLAWQDVQRVELARWPWMLFAPSLKVQLHDGQVRWLPRDTARLAELHALALRVVGAEHPLVQALATPLHRL